MSNLLAIHAIVIKNFCKKKIVAKEKVEGSPKSVVFILWGARMSTQIVLAMDLIVVEIFQSTSNCWIAISIATQLAWLRTSVINLRITK